MIAETPIWDEREQPTVQITDRDISGACQPTLRQLQPASEGKAFTSWVNSYREPMYRDIDSDSKLTSQRLASKGICVQDVTTVVSSITKSPSLSVQRVHSNGHLRQNRWYNEAVGAITPNLSFTTDDTIDGQYNPLLGVVALNEHLLREGSTPELVGAIAENIGQASTGPLINVSTPVESDMPFAYWLGYQWHYQGERYGDALQNASAAKIAALAVLALGAQPKLMPHEAFEDHPLLQQYQRHDKLDLSYETGVAMALDTINQALGFAQHEPGIYEPIWEFGKSGGDENARQELARMIARATDNCVTLEQFETLEPQVASLPLSFMQQVEEACKIPRYAWVTRAITRRSYDTGVVPKSEGF